MSLYYNNSGTWRTVKYVWAKVSSNWRECAQIWVRVSGTWYPIWEYSWVPSAWTSCSKTCGGGTQTRTLTCERNDGFTFDNSYCEKFAGTKPSTSQSCNTQSCVTVYGCELRYENSSGRGCGTNTSMVPVTGVFTKYKNMSYGTNPYWLQGSNITGTFYKTTDNGQSCDIRNCWCYVVSNGYKYYASSSDKSTKITEITASYHDADNGGGECAIYYSYSYCYPLNVEPV